MKEYILGNGNKHFKTISKYIAELDQTISSVVNFLDFYKPNYIILNKEYVASGLWYYKNFDKLQEKQIIIDTRPIGSDIDTDYLRLNLDFLGLNQIIVNNFGVGKIKVFFNNIEQNQTIPEGFVLINQGLDNNKRPIYLIVSLDSAGTYYLMTKQENDAITWTYTPKATDDFGTDYVFSLAPAGTRFCYKRTDINYTLKLIETSSTIVYNYIQDSLEKLVSINNTYWTRNHILGYDIYGITGTPPKIAEEIVCDCKAEVSEVQNNNRTTTRHIIITNLPQSCSYLKFYINYY